MRLIRSTLYDQAATTKQIATATPVLRLVDPQVQ